MALRCRPSQRPKLVVGRSVMPTLHQEVLVVAPFMRRIVESQESPGHSALGTWGRNTPVTPVVGFLVSCKRSRGKGNAL